MEIKLAIDGDEYSVDQDGHVRCPRCRRPVGERRQVLAQIILTALGHTAGHAEPASTPAGYVR